MVNIRIGAIYSAQLLMLMLIASRVVADSQSALQWLDRMSHSYRELNYRGAFSYQRDTQMKSFRITHAVIDGEEYERLEYLDGEKRNVVRQGHQLDCLHAGHKLIRFIMPNAIAGKDLAASAGQSPSTPALEHYYQLSVSGDDRLAGREVVNIRIEPRDTLRYGYRLSLDRQTGLPLRSELVDPGGEVLERFQFVELEIGMAIDKSVFDGMPRTMAAPHEMIPGAAHTEIEQDWHPAWVPGGFAAAAGKPARGRDMVTYTDGLAVFSVFVEPVQVPVAAPGASLRKGATTAHSRVLEAAGRPYLVTVVGEIPSQTAERVAQSVAVGSR